MKTFAQKIARLVSAEFTLEHRAGGRSVDEAELAAFIADHIKREVRRGVLTVGGECDGEFSQLRDNGKHFQGYSALDREWNRRPFLSDEPFENEVIKTSYYQLVPIRMSTDEMGMRFEEFKIAAVEGMNPAEMMRALINNYRP